MTNKLEKKLDVILASFTTEELKELFEPNPFIKGIRRDFLIKRIKDIPFSKENLILTLQKIKEGKKVKLQIKFIPDYNKITQTQMKELIEKKGLVLPKKKSGAKKLMYKILFDIDIDDNENDKEEQEKKEMKDSSEFYNALINNEYEPPSFNSIKKKELLAELEEKNIYFVDNDVITKRDLYNMLYKPRRYRGDTRQSYINISSLTRLIKDNFIDLGSSSNINSKLYKLNKFAAYFDMNYILEKGKEGKGREKLPFPTEYFPTFPTLYTSEEIARIVKDYDLDSKDNIARTILTIDHYKKEINYNEIEDDEDDEDDEEEDLSREEVIEKGEKKMKKDIRRNRMIKKTEKNALNIALIQERIKFTTISHPMFKIRKEGTNSIYYIIRPDYVYSYSINEIVSMVNKGVISYNPEMPDDPTDEELIELEDSKFAKKLDDYDLISLENLCKLYIFELYPIYQAIKILYSNIKMLELGKLIDDRPKDKILKIHMDEFEAINQGGSIKLVPRSYSPIYRKILNQKLREVKLILRPYMSKDIYRIVTDFIYRKIKIPSPVTSPSKKKKIIIRKKEKEKDGS